MNKGSLGRKVKGGIIGGIIGGILFGIMMQMMGMISMISGMIGSNSLVVGWIIHMMISIIFGLTFGFVTIVVKNLWLASIVFGVGIWIVGPLMIMPVMMGMGTRFAEAFTPDLLMSLGTHLFFAVMVAIVFKVISIKQDTNKQVSV